MQVLVGAWDMLGHLAPLCLGMHCALYCPMSAPALWVWMASAVCEALVMKEDPGRGSECLLNQHFFDSVALASNPRRLKIRPGGHCMGVSAHARHNYPESG